MDKIIFKFLVVGVGLIPSVFDCPTINSAIIIVMKTVFKLHVFLRENQLKLPSAPETLLPSFSTVKVIFLNRMQFEWYEVMIT